MHFKLIIALVANDKTESIIQATREQGATGSTVISNARGEGLECTKTFLGMNMENPRDMLLFLVEQHLAKNILETIAITGGFKSDSNEGIAFQINVEDVIGVQHQIQALTQTVEKKI